MSTKRPAQGRRGASAIEFALLLPWVIFLFVGAFDWGFYAHALISTQSAARSVALYGANISGGTVSSTTACTVAIQELSISANMSGITSCSGPISDSQPVVVTLSCTALDSVNSLQATVNYRTAQLVPIPGLLTGKTTVGAMAQLPMKNNTSCATS